MNIRSYSIDGIALENPTQTLEATSDLRPHTASLTPDGSSGASCRLHISGFVVEGAGVAQISDPLATGASRSPRRAP